ncbi:hypothetical protein BU24DRAFT_128154 [Aaosphaeria arxii CBS 175.79]|uniref:Uncharacterized protein n=1 Tax=Aaosphaeria arxii CBS 175.79 TaxID=1450172 RepID=A0A6A5Y3M1_9PLEO|nr:uncharacterized protein BU24DRAFT_128154 [Aaosphaeria arxii CBS 175.79]KAF2019856.1 hypothetical protein BU24DRAFT_128154 [Aaosphaeria arxii CBS 175.79]
MELEGSVQTTMEWRIDDEEYLRILPRYFAITEETKKAAERSIITDEDPSKYFAHFLAWLVDPLKATRPNEVLLRSIRHEIEKFEDEYTSIRGLSDIELFYHVKALRSLHHVGLQIRSAPGGTFKAMKIGVERARDMGGFLTNCIIVENACKARQYVDIGLRLDVEDIEGYPMTVEEAVKYYSPLLGLVAPTTRNNAFKSNKLERLDRELDTEWIWLSRREAFRSEVLERARGTVIDSVLGELDTEQSQYSRDVLKKRVQIAYD